jgi:hypothetical protein
MRHLLYLCKDFTVPISDASHFVLYKSFQDACEDCEKTGKTARTEIEVMCRSEWGSPALRVCEKWDYYAGKLYKYTDKEIPPPPPCDEDALSSSPTAPKTVFLVKNLNTHFNLTTLAWFVDRDVALRHMGENQPCIHPMVLDARKFLAYRSESLTSYKINGNKFIRTEVIPWQALRCTSFSSAFAND